MTEPVAPAKPSVWSRAASYVRAWLRSPQGKRDIVIAATALYNALHRAGVL